MGMSTRVSLLTSFRLSTLRETLVLKCTYQGCSKPAEYVITDEYDFIEYPQCVEHTKMAFSEDLGTIMVIRLDHAKDAVERLLDEQNGVLDLCF